MSQLKEILDSEKVGLISEQYPTYDFRDQFFESWDKVLNGPDMSSLVFEDINDNWKFIKDSENIGESEGYYKADYDYSFWQDFSVETNWETIIGSYDGYGWYKTKKTFKKGKHIFLCIGAVDEDAWIYVNGQLILDHSHEKLGVSTYQIWTMPIAVDITPYLVEGDNDITIKVHDCLNAGGIYKGVKVGYTDSDEIKSENIEFIM